MPKCMCTNRCTHCLIPKIKHIRSLWACQTILAHKSYTLIFKYIKYSYKTNNEIILLVFIENNIIFGCPWYCIYAIKDAIKLNHNKATAVARLYIQWLLKHQSPITHIHSTNNLSPLASKAVPWDTLAPLVPFSLVKRAPTLTDVALRESYLNFSTASIMTSWNKVLHKDTLQTTWVAVCHLR